METQQSWRLKLSFRNATIFLCFFNVIAVLLLLQGFLSSYSSSFNTNLNSVKLRSIRESEETRRAMQPLELIKRVKEIQQETYTEPEMLEPKETKQTSAIDLTKRLKDIRSLTDAGSVKALEEWRKRKTERQRLRELEKNRTITSQA
ncbi:hypothetical protein RJ641_021499 [Dillenia turbinata]|uniref:Transmembrane protein n=1 Tax=Dillenia turbinata TaxID=194707 RepID=A0AAN8YYF9_9MAGN